MQFSVTTITMYKCLNYIIVICLVVITSATVNKILSLFFCLNGTRWGRPMSRNGMVQADDDDDVILRRATVARAAPSRERASIVYSLKYYRCQQRDIISNCSERSAPASGRSKKTGSELLERIDVFASWWHCLNLMLPKYETQTALCFFLQYRPLNANIKLLF